MLKDSKIYIYLSCLREERDLLPVVAFRQWLEANSIAVAFADADDINGRKHVVENWAAFVAVVGEGYQGSSWLNGELYDAVRLSRAYPSSRPLVFGLSIDGAGLPRCSEGLVSDWLTSGPSYLPLLRFRADLDAAVVKMECLANISPSAGTTHTWFWKMPLWRKLTQWRRL